MDSLPSVATAAYATGPFINIFLSVNPNLLGLLGFFVRRLLLVQPLQMRQELGRRGFFVLDFVDCDIEF
jgi:hypothetical protein